jgi:hypothetical protein
VSLLNKNPWLTATLLLTLTACGGATSDTAAPDDTAAPSDTAAPADTAAPTVSSTSPLNSATSVARDSAITATFDEDMFATTVDASSFTLDKSGNINGTVTFEANTNVATFTSDSELAILSTYTATLSTDITDLSGNPLVNDYNWSFTTAEGSWGTAEPITTGTLFRISPQVALDGSGNAIAVWYQFNNAAYDIYASYFNGTTWGTAELIETGTNDANSPQVSFDGSGNAIAVWLARPDGVYRIWSNRFNGTSWGNAELIGTGVDSNAGDPQIAVDSSGNAIAVWHQEDTNGVDNIWANHFDVNRSGGPGWGTAELIEINDVGDAADSQVAIDSSGHAIAVWRQFDGSVYNIWANRFNGIIWGTAQLIENDDVGNAYFPQVGVDSSGNAIVVWQQTVITSTAGAYVPAWANRFNGSSWGTPELIGIGTYEGNAEFSQVSVNSSGHAIAVWQQWDGTAVSIYANRFDGTSWGTAELIETNDNGRTRNAQVAVDGSGNAIAVWIQHDENNLESIWTNRFDGSSWGTAELLETNDNGGADNPQVEIDSSGNATAVWSKAIDFDRSIYANRFK